MKDSSITIYIFLDNLRVHYSLRVREYCRENKIELVFNAAYSSEYNPIERLWALSKRIFRLKLAATNDHSQANVKKFVLESILEVPSRPIYHHVMKCIRRMRDERNEV